MRPHLMILLGAAGLIVVGGSVLTGQARAQGGEIKIAPQDRSVLCPHPGSLTLQATAAPSVNDADFPPLGPTQKPAVLNLRGDPQVNHTFRYTFNWNAPAHLCCEITKAVLTVKLRWNGGEHHLRTAANDKISIMDGGKPVAGMEGYIWGPSATPTSTSETMDERFRRPDPPTKTIIMPMNADALLVANKGGRLSFQVQDDTTVESAVLAMDGCCVSHPDSKK